MIQLFNKHNQELTMVRSVAFPIAQPVVAQLGQYNFTLPIKHLGWAHNLILLQQVKDIRARYWYIADNRTYRLVLPHRRQPICKDTATRDKIVD